MDRLQKVIAKAGVCSRRKAEELISAGRVMVNGKTVRRLGTKVDPKSDRIAVDGETLEREPRVYCMLNKPAGVVSTAHDPEGRTTVLQLVPQDVRFYPVGRLDYDTEGLLLLTNDGELTYRLTHPSHEIDKVYVAELRGRLGSVALQSLREGVDLEDGRTSPAKVSVLQTTDSATVVEMTIHEGRNRQIRRMAEHVGFPVVRLVRLAIGPIRLGDLRRGRWRYLTDAELDALKKSVDM